MKMKMKMKQKQVLIKLAQVRMAINHVLRTRGMMKQALLNEVSPPIKKKFPEPYSVEANKLQLNRNRPPLPPHLAFPPGFQEDFDTRKKDLQEHRSQLPVNRITGIIPYYMGFTPRFPGAPNPYYYRRFDKAKQVLPLEKQLPSVPAINLEWIPYYFNYKNWNDRLDQIYEELDGQEWEDERERLRQEADYIQDTKRGLESKLRFYDNQAEDVCNQKYDIEDNDTITPRTRAMYQGDYNKAVQYARQFMGLKPGQKLMTRRAVTTPSNKWVRSPITGESRQYYQDAENPMIQDPFRDVPTQEEWDLHYPRMQKQWAKQDARDLRSQAVRRALSKGINALSKPVVSAFLPTPVQMALPYAKYWDDMEQRYNSGAYKPLNHPKGETENYLWE